MPYSVAVSSRFTVFINTRDRVTYLRELVNWLERAGVQRIIIVDNASTYEPLLDYLAHTPHHVVRLKENMGQLAPWLSGTIERMTSEHDFFMETDPDVVPDENCPLDALEHLYEIVYTYPEYVKVGLGLRIDDLPDHYRHADAVRRWESRFWTEEFRPGLYVAPVDTTFAVYRPRTGTTMIPALRTGPPYVARHMPWYADSKHPTKEDRYYLRHAAPGINNWDARQITNRISDFVGLPRQRDRSVRAFLRQRLERHHRGAGRDGGDPVTPGGTPESGPADSLH
jgi:hypothetical protein